MKKLCLSVFIALASTASIASDVIVNCSGGKLQFTYEAAPNQQCRVSQNFRVNGVNAPDRFSFTGSAQREISLNMDDEVRATTVLRCSGERGIRRTAMSDRGCHEDAVTTPAPPVPPVINEPPTTHLPPINTTPTTPETTTPETTTPDASSTLPESNTAELVKTFEQALAAILGHIANDIKSVNAMREFGVDSKYWQYASEMIEHKSNVMLEELIEEIPLDPEHLAGSLREYQENLGIMLHQL